LSPPARERTRRKQWVAALLRDEMRQAEEAARQALESALLSAAAAEQDAAGKRVCASGGSRP
jgi:hypothetical protein